MAVKESWHPEEKRHAAKRASVLEVKELQAMKSRIQLLIIAVSLAIITIVLGSAQVLG